MLQQAAQQLSDSIMSVMKMDSAASSTTVTNSLDNSLRIVVHPTPSVDLATIVESTSNGILNNFVNMCYVILSFDYLIF